MPVQKRRIIRPVNIKCGYCEKSQMPDYKDWQTLKTYVTERGKILGRTRTGLCQKHQRRLAIAVKQARHLARIPFVTTLV